MADRNAQAEGIGLPPGTKIGKYEVRERQGVGGQAIVYRAYDPLLDRYVAIKQISSHLAEDPKFLERFRREAQILARLGSDIITVHDLIEEERGLFIVMEWVEGHTLESTLNSTPAAVEPKATLQILWRLAATLHEVHAAGIIHRDLKPSNIIITEGLRPRITDFGVAASTSGQTSMVLGTTKYMAPELFEGGETDQRVDIYSLGFVAYEMLLGRAKFNELFADVVRDKHSEALRWMKWHGNRKVEAPSLSEVNPAIPPRLSALVDRMIAKDPAERFQSMEELGRAIKNTFSVKGRTAGASSEQLIATRGRRAAAAAGGVGPGDEADELHVPGAVEPEPDELRTAELPKTSLTLRTKLILGGVALLGLVSIAVVLGVQSSNERRQFERQADTVYQQAFEDDYKAGLSGYQKERFEAALEGFRQALQNYRGTEAAMKAPVMIAFCQAHLAVLRENWNDAAEMEAEADRAIGEVERRGGPEKWIDDRRQEVRNFSEYRENTRRFVTYMADAKKAHEDGKLDLAKEIVQTNLAQLRLTDPQMRQVDAFVRNIQLTQFRGDLQAQIAKGTDLAKQGQFAEAIRAYQAAEGLLNQEEASVMPAEQREAFRQQVVAKMKEAGVSGEYRTAMDKAREAREAGDKAEELRWLEQADQISPSPENQKAIARLKSDIVLAEGTDLLDKGQYAAAKAKIEQALQYDPDNARAAGELNRLTRGQQRESLLSEAKVAFNAGDYEAALGKYQQAGRIRMDDPVRSRINECRYRIQFAKAEALREAKKYDEARRFYDQAVRINRDARPQISAILAKMDQDQRYEAAMADGQAALARKDYPSALKAYQAAKDVYNNDEVNRQINRVHYERYMASGDREMEQLRYSAAIGLYKIAQDKMDTPEIRAKIEEARKMQQQEEGG